jgi:hypothetical protein
VHDLEGLVGGEIGISEDREGIVYIALVFADSSLVSQRMLGRMGHKLRTYTPSIVVAVLVIGLATPAFADIPPSRKHERETRTLEPHHAPPMDAPAAPEPASEVTPEAEPVPTPEVPPSPEPEAKAESKQAGSCSIDDGPEHGVLGLGTLVLFVAGASLRRRRA